MEEHWDETDGTLSTTPVRLTRRRVLRGIGTSAAGAMAIVFLGDRVESATIDMRPEIPGNGTEGAISMTQTQDTRMNVENLAQTQTPATAPIALALVKQFYAAYAKEDLAGMRGVFAPEVVWRIPGRNSVSGDHVGIDETMFFFTQLTKGNFKADVHALVGNEEYAIDFHRGWGAFGDQSLDIEWVIVWRVANGKIVEGRDFAFDQDAADIFYSAVYPLKPLSQRLV